MTIPPLKALLVALMCLGILCAPAGRAVYAAGPAATPPALPAVAQQVVGVSATAPALPAGNSAYTAPTAGSHAAGGSSSDTTPLHLPAYTPVGAGADATLSGASLLGLLAKFVAVLALLFVALRILRAVMPRFQGAGAGLTPGGMVLYNETLGDKKRACLLDLGERLVLVGVGTTDMSALATIDDPTEVAALRARYGPQRPRMPAAGARPSFAAALKEAVTRPAAAHAETDIAPTMPRMNTASDVMYGSAGPRASMNAAGANGQGGAGTPDVRVSGALERMRHLREKIEAL